MRFPPNLGEGFDAEAADKRSDARQESVHDDFVEKQLNCSHDYRRAKKVGAAYYICPICQADISHAMFLMLEVAGG